MNTNRSKRNDAFVCHNRRHFVVGEGADKANSWLLQLELITHRSRYSYRRIHKSPIRCECNCEWEEIEGMMYTGFEMSSDSILNYVNVIHSVTRVRMGGKRFSGKPFSGKTFQVTTNDGFWQLATTFSGNDPFRQFKKSLKI